MVRLTLAAAAALIVAGCGKEEAPPPPKPKAEKAPHCFFKESETKEWKIAPDKDGGVAVTGRAFRSDARYKAVLMEPKIEGRTAVVRPSISLNDTGFAADENWWDLKTVVPAESIDLVEVRCGKALLASFPVDKDNG